MAHGPAPSDGLLRTARLRSRLARALARLAVCAGGIALVTGLAYGLDTVAPSVSLGALYLLVIVPIAIQWGLAWALFVSVASMLTLNFLFLPPLYTFTLADGDNWVALGMYVGVAAAVAELAARSKRRASEAEQREREEALLAEIATSLLRGRSVSAELDRLADRLGGILKVKAARIELGPKREPLAGQSPYELRAGDALVGTLYVTEGPEGNLSIRRRFLPTLASLPGGGNREGAVGGGGPRGRGSAAKRRDQDCRPTRGEPRPPVPADRDHHRRREPDQRELVLAREDREELLDTIQVEANRLERLVRDLLDLSRLEAGAAEPLLELWTVDELVGQALEDLGPGSDRIDVAIPVSIPAVRVDAGQVRRALANLLENAVKFSPADEQVSVRATATRKEVIIRVVDRGPGLSPEDAQHAFEPFFRGAAPARSRGSGLGLAIVRGFTEANGGRVWVESRPGQGSSFAIAFEAVPPEPALMGS